MLVNVQFLSVLVRLLFLLGKQTQVQPAEVADGVRTHRTVQSMVQQHNLMSNLVILLSDEDVPRMSIAVYETIFEYHSREYVNQVVGDLRCVDACLNKFVPLVDLDAINKLHYDQPIRGKFGVVLRYVYLRVVLEQFLRLKRML